jgi:hypothetical protein
MRAGISSENSSRSSSAMAATTGHSGMHWAGGHSHRSTAGETVFY